MDHNDTENPGSGKLHAGWLIALAFFVLAGSTGVLYRFGLAYGYTAGLDLVNIRHAHSHLMYFGWATPALVAIIATWLPGMTGKTPTRSAKWILGTIFTTALIAFPSFLAFGYTPAEIAGRRIPLSEMAAGLNVIGWYFFVGYYAWQTRGVPRNRVLMLWDISLLFLVLATLGAWGLASLKPLGVESLLWTTALTHVFLDLFSEGWFVVAVLGGLYAAMGEANRPAGHWSLWLIVAGLPVTFAFGMPSSLIAPGFEMMARIGGAMVGLGLATQAVILLRSPAGRKWIWRVPLFFLGFKAAIQIGMSVVPVEWWSGHHGLRILYLHVMLLGVVSLGLVAIGTGTWRTGRNRTTVALYVAVGVLLFSLIPMTSLWPAPWTGTWVFRQAAWIAPLPVLAVLWILVMLVRKKQNASDPD